MKKVVWLWMLLIMMAGSLWAQDEYHIKNFGKNDELKTRGATRIAQINGFIWVGSSDGFYAFDGAHMYKYEIPDEDSLGGYFSCVTSLAAAPDSTLWVGSRRGIYHFSMGEERLHKVTPDGTPKNPNVLQMMFDKEGYLWSIMNGKVYKIDVKQNAAECVGEGTVSPSCITVTKDGTVWLGDSEGKLYRYDSATLRLRSYSIEPEGAEAFTSLVSITEMRNGQLALTSANDGICIFSPDKHTAKMLLTRDDEGSPIVAHTATTINGDNLWIGTERGVIIYNMRNKHLRGIRQSRNALNSLSDNSVHTLFVDQENGVWVGTYFGGIDRISTSQHNFTLFMAEDEDVDVVREIHRDNFGHVWAGTEDGGLYLMDKENSVLRRANIDWGGNPAPFNVQGMVLIDDDLWVSSITNGIYVVDTKAMRLKRRFEKTNKSQQGQKLSIKTLCHQNGTLFAGSWSGVYIFDEKTEEFYTMPGMSNVHAQRLYGDRHGNVWVASFDKGLWKIEQDKKGQWKGKQTAFNYMCVSAVFEDSRGTFWVGTDMHGLMRYDDKTGETDAWEQSAQLSKEYVTNIVEDTHHRLWINTFNGLYCYNLSKNVLNHVTTANGLPSNYLSYASGFVDKDGSVYIGTYKGMIGFNPAQFIMSRERLKPYFLNLYVNGRHILPNDETGILQQTLFMTKELTLSRDQNTFTIYYAVPSYRSGEVVWYRYRLNPDEPWVVTDNAQPIQLANLSAGTYKITLQASFNPERWEGEAASIIVTVKPPVWLSPYAFFGYAIVIILMALGSMSIFKRLAKRHEEKKNEERVFQKIE